MPLRHAVQNALRGRVARPLSGWDVGKILTFSAFPLIPALAPIGYYGAAPWLSPLLVLVIVPLVDLVLRNDRSTDALREHPAVAALLRLVPFVYAVVWAVVLGWALWILRSHALPASTTTWLLVSVGIGSAFATCAAHEMLHWPESSARAAARLIMATVAYGPFPLEHLHHHAAVGLRDQGTTPPLGQGLWSYLAQNVPYTFVSARRSERERQRRRSATIAQNRFVQQVALTVVMAVAFAAVAGWPGLLLFAVQAAFGIYTTEYVNYAQHYGLSRNPAEPITGNVSWSSNGLLTNALTLNITRHADHHVNGALRYYELKALTGAPALPAGYLGLFFPAMVPALWRAVMDKRARRVTAAGASASGNQN